MRTVHSAIVHRCPGAGCAACAWTDRRRGVRDGSRRWVRYGADGYPANLTGGQLPYNSPVAHSTPKAPADQTAAEPTMRGVKSGFRPKVQPGISVTLTQLGLDILNAAHERTGLSRSDVCEKLLRLHGAQLTNDQPDDE
jgi:hypothetical protein